jgi:hypothetical protein
VNPPLYVPSAVGRAAIAEIDRVPWAELKTSGGLLCDLRGQLALLADENPYAAEQAKELLSSSIYNQGDLFQATPYAVPFIAAYGAGDDVWNEGVDHMAALLAWIAESAATETRVGPRLDAARNTRTALAACAAHLRRIVERCPPFRKAERMIAEIAAATTISDELLARIEELRYPVPW